MLEEILHYLFAFLGFFEVICRISKISPEICNLANFFSLVILPPRKGIERVEEISMAIIILYSQEVSNTGGWG
jgi:hypothetical protein